MRIFRWLWFAGVVGGVVLLMVNVWQSNLGPWQCAMITGMAFVCVVEFFCDVLSKQWGFKSEWVKAEAPIE